MQRLKFEVTDKYDLEFINLLLEIEKKQEQLNKGQRIKIQSWIKKFCIPTENLEWKKNRNLHSILLLDMIINNRFEEPFDKFPREDEPLPLLSKYIVKSILSEKFYEKNNFTNCEKNLEDVEIEKVKDKYTLSQSISRNKLIEKKILLKQSNTNHNQTNEKMNNTSNNLSQSSNFTTKKFSYQSNDLLKTRSNIITNTYSESNYAWDIEKLKRLVNSLQEQINDGIIFKNNKANVNLENKIDQLETFIHKKIFNNEEYTPDKNTKHL